MNRMFRMLCAVALAAVTLTSCLKNDDEDTTTYSDVAITQLTLGTLNRYTTTKSANTGNDTVVKTTVVGSSYPMTIDHLGHKVYNQKELPVGTDVEHVVFSTVSAKNSGMVALWNLTRDSLQWLTTTDSIDFRVPREVRVYSSNGLYWRDYTITVNVSQDEGLTFSWLNLGVKTTATHLVVMGGTVRGADRGVVVKDALAYRLTGTTLETSADLMTWTSVAEQPSLRQLLGTGTEELFALGTDGLLMSSKDNGQNWQVEGLDEIPMLLPDDNIAMVSWPYAPVDSTDYVLMVGTNSRQTDTGYATVWRKISQYGGPTEGGKWVYMPLDSTNPYMLPALNSLSLVYFDGSVLCLGSDGVIRQSRDEGITWKASTLYDLPSSFTGKPVSMVADTKGRLWVLTDLGELWQGMKR